MSNRLKSVQDQRQRRINRVSKNLRGTAERPRLKVSISNQHVRALLIDDDAQKTIAAVTTVGKKSAKGSLTDKAAWTGAEIAKTAQKHKIKRVIFDRGYKRYHGRVKQLAESAREAGLEF